MRQTNAKTYKALAHQQARDAEVLRVASEETTRHFQLELETLHRVLLRDIEAIEQKLISMVQTAQIQRSDFIELCVRLDAMKQGLAVQV